MARKKENRYHVIYCHDGWRAVPIDPNDTDALGPFATEDEAIEAAGGNVVNETPEE